MIENKLIIVIDKSIEEVFEFTTNPKNTHKWITSITEEKTDQWPISIGSVYLNTSDGINWDTYELIEYIPNKVFTLKSQGSNYHVRYSYSSVQGERTELEYFEWNKDGLSKPFTQETLNTLKEVMEQ